MASLGHASRALRGARLAVLIATACFLPAAPAAAEDNSPPIAICPNPEISFTGVISVPDGSPAGAEYVACMPEPGDWIGDVMIFAHGTVDPRAEPGKIESIVGQLSIDELVLPEIANDLGYAFAVLSRSDLGLSEAELAREELIQLVAAFAEDVDASPVFPSFEGFAYLVGPSLGGLFTTLLLEQAADAFDGGLAACAPIGSFRKQVNYWGDLLVVFDHFFPQFELLNPPEQVPPTEADVALVREDILEVWDEFLGSAIREALEANPATAREIATVVGVPTDPTGHESVAETVFEVLEAAVLITNDAIATLGGNPLGNKRRLYVGSENDLALNRGVKRYEANADALATVAARYETSGALGAPLVTLHTVLDPRQPYWHEPLYRRKVLAQGSAARHTNLPVSRFGHCNFEPAEVLVTFALLVLKVEGWNVVPDIARALVDPAQGERFWALADQVGLLR